MMRSSCPGFARRPTSSAVSARAFCGPPGLKCLGTLGSSRPVQRLPRAPARRGGPVADADPTRRILTSTVVVAADEQQQVSIADGLTPSSALESSTSRSSSTSGTSTLSGGSGSSTSGLNGGSGSVSSSSTSSSSTGAQQPSLRPPVSQQLQPPQQALAGSASPPQQAAASALQRSPSPVSTSSAASVGAAQPSLTSAATHAAALPAPTAALPAPAQAVPKQQPALAVSGSARVGSKKWWAKLPWPKIWALTLLSVSYVHQATTGFALPAMLPMVSAELSLSDFQGALLTTGYSYLYAFALVPVGLLADRFSRPKLLAVGLGLWSMLTITASGCKSFNELLLARVGFAAAQSAQNPICFGLIPELFPKRKSTALALYNCAIYVGRALSFGAVLLARHLHDAPPTMNPDAVEQTVVMVPMDALDLHSMSIVYTSGDMAAVTPVYDYNFDVVQYGAQIHDSAWRQVLHWIALPGFIIAMACLFTLPEPREAKITDADQPPSLATSSMASTNSVSASMDEWAAPPPAPVPSAFAAASFTYMAAGGGGTAAAALPEAAKSGTWDSVCKLLHSPTFMTTTFAAALNDVGSYALIAWQSTFYERVYHLQPSVYAPILALLLPVSGIIGGVGGGALADYMAKRGGRIWITAGASLLAAPCIAESLLAGSYQESFLALFFGFALSEAWRAPTAVMARSTAPASLGSTSSALYLCIRNLVGGLGPLAVAAMAPSVGLQRAMLLVPAAYVLSGLTFVVAERLFEKESMERGTCNI